MSEMVKENKSMQPVDINITDENDSEDKKHKNEHGSERKSKSHLDLRIDTKLANQQHEEHEEHEEDEEDEDMEPIVVREESLSDVSILDNTIDPAYVAFVDNLRCMIKQRKLLISDELTFMEALKYAIELVEFGIKLDGSTKKKYVIFGLRRIVKHLDGIDESVKYVILKNLDNGMVGSTIDLIVSASKSKLKLNRPVYLFFKKWFVKVNLWLCT